MEFPILNYENSIAFKKAVAYIFARFLDLLQAFDPRFTMADVEKAIARDRYHARVERFLTSQDGSNPTSLYCVILPPQISDDICVESPPLTTSTISSALIDPRKKFVPNVSSSGQTSMVDRIVFTASLSNTRHAFRSVIYAIKLPVSPLQTEDVCVSGTFYSPQDKTANPLIDVATEVLFGSMDADHQVEEIINIIGDVFVPMCNVFHTYNLHNIESAPPGYSAPYRLNDTLTIYEDSMKEINKSVRTISKLYEDARVNQPKVDLKNVTELMQRITCTHNGYLRASSDPKIASDVKAYFANCLRLLNGKDKKEKCSGFYVTTNENKMKKKSGLNSSYNVEKNVVKNYSISNENCEGVSVDGAEPAPSTSNSQLPPSESGNEPESKIEFQMVPETYGPVAEQESWSRFEVEIYAELERLRTPEIKSLLCVLELADPTLYKKMVDCQRRLSLAADEATNVSRHFPAVTEKLKDLFTSDPVEAMASIDGLVISVEHLVKVIPYYREKDHLTLMCLCISNQLIMCSKNAIRRGGRVWEQADCIPMLRTMLDNFETTINLSRKFREEIMKREVFSLLEELVVFGKLELFCTRLTKMIELFNCVLTYRILAEHHLDDIETLLAAFFNAFDELRRKSGDCLDYTKPAFDRDFFEFRKKIAEIDRSLNVYINFSFEKVSNTVASLLLLQKYQILMQRDSIKPDLQAKYLVMFQRYGADVETVQRVYEEHKADPPVMRNATPVANRIMWSRHLLRRIEEPMNIFQACHSIVSHQRDISKVIRLYNRVAITLTKYEAFWINTWKKVVDDATSGMHATALVRHPETNELIVNFDQSLDEIVKESKWMVLLGVDLPSSAKGLLQHRMLTNYASQLGFLVKRAHTIVKKVDPLHTEALKSVIDEIECDLFEPALSTITWSSSKLPPFLEHVTMRLDEIEVLVDRVNGIVSCRINPSLSQIAATNILVNPIQALLAALTTGEGKPTELQADVASRMSAENQGILTTQSENGISLQPSDFLLLQEERATDVSNSFTILNSVVRQAAVDLCQLIDPSWAPRIEDCENSLTYLYSHYNRQLFRSVLRSNVLSLSHLNGSLGHVELSDMSNRNFMTLSMEISGRQVLLLPSLDEIQSIMNSCVGEILRTSKCLGEWPNIRGAYNTSEPANFFEEVSRNKEVVKSVLLITGSLFGLRRQLTDFLNTFERFNCLWKNDPQVVVRNFTQNGQVHRPLSQYEEELSYCVELQGRVNIIEDCFKTGCVTVVCVQFKRQLLDLIKKWKQCYGNALTSSADVRLSWLQDHSDSIYKKMLQTVPEDFVYLLDEMNALECAKTWELKTENELQELDESVALMESHGVVCPMDITDRIIDLRRRWKRIHELANEKHYEVSKMQYIYKRDLAASIAHFGVDIICFRNNFTSNGPLVEGVMAPDGVDRVKKFQRLLDDKMRHWQSNINAENIFHYPQHLYPELALTVKEMHTATRLYNLYSSCMKSMYRARNELWVNVNYSKLVEELLELQASLKKLPAYLKQYDAYKESKKYTDLYLEMEAIVEQLSHKSIKERHWQEMMKICGHTWSTDRHDFRLHHVVDANLLPYKDEIVDLALASEKEEEIQVKISRIANECKEQELSFAEYKQRGPITLKSDDTALLQESLEEGVVILGSLLASKFIAPFRAEAQMWVNKLVTIGESLSLILEVQALWMYLETVFAGGDIMKQLPQESKRFAMVDKQWAKLFYKAMEIRNVSDFCYENNSLKSLPYLKDQLEVCQRALSTYLEQKRNAFARFYFVSDAILLEVLSQGSDPNTVQPHLPSIFDGIATMSLQMNEEKRQFNITKFHSADGETVQMVEQVTCQGNVECWLDKLCDEMQRSIRFILREAVSELDTTRSDPDYFKHFIHKFPSQVVLTALQIRYTADVQSVLDGRQSSRKDLGESLIEVKEIFAEQARKSDLSESQKTHIESLTTMAVHNLEIWDATVKRAKDSNTFDWKKQLRFYWSDSSGCLLQIADANLWFCYEYLGIKERLVITPLTDRCYVTLSQALAMYMGGAPAGPAGTGKTETVKDLGRAAGKYVVVFNCSDQWDVRSLGKIFKGLAQSGSWGCFDEFNRITLPVLSVVSQQIGTIFLGLRQRTGTFVFTSGQVCKLNDGVGIFVTMNPGYAGRQELPENLKAMFRGVTMMLPDRQVIMKTKLAACGYKNDAQLSLKFNMLYRMCEHQLSGHRHYDFGLRNILSVLRSAGDLLRKSKSNDEESVFLKCVKGINISKLVHGDVPVFLSLLNDIFPNKSADTQKVNAIDAALERACEESGRCASKGFITKCIQIYETKMVRHGIMIVGPAMGGKTSCISTLLAALGEIERKHREVRMNPKAITANQMFGVMNPTTGDWTDGIFSYLWRKTNKEMNMSIWLICDGPVDTLWIESLNTVLDDNKLLTLANGDRILMNPTLKMAFETENLANASPATVSRAGIIFISPQDVGWDPVFYGMISSKIAEKKWSSVVANQILKLGREHLDSLYKHIIQFAKSYLNLSLQHFISTIVQICDPLLQAATNNALMDRDKGKENLIPVTVMTFWYGVTWGIGGSLDASDREGFLKYIEDYLPNYPKMPRGRTLFDVFVNVTECRWGLWSERVPVWTTTWDPNLPYVDSAKVFIPTKESTIMHSLLLNHFKLGKSALLVGAEGAAKTITMEKFLTLYSHDDDHKSWTKMNVSQATTPQMLQGGIEEHCEKRIGTIYGPKRNRQLAIFFDDLNMSHVNEWGDQEACELLRQIMEWNGIFSLQRIGEWKKLVDLRFFGAMSVSTGGFVGGGVIKNNNSEIPMRLMRHFAVYAMPFPNDTTLTHVYGSILKGRFGALSHISHIVSPVVEATLSLWRSCCRSLLPTPTRFHYSFNLRDLSRISQGLLMCCPASIHTESIFISLWHHECSRVLCDKLCLSEDVTFFNKTIEECCRTFFDGESCAVKCQPVANFCRDAVVDHITGEVIDEPMVYELVDKKEALTKVITMMNMYNEQKRVVKVDIVMFDFALRHLLRISRILGTPRGSALLIGVGGSGKQSLTRVAAYIQKQPTFSPTITSSYTLYNWLDDIRIQFLAAGIQGPCTFLITDAHLKEESYFEYINAALASGDVPGLFSMDEKENARSAIRQIAKKVARKQFEDSEVWLWNFFINRVRENLHFVLCFSPQGQSFCHRVRQFPGIVASCTIDFFFPWPTDALCDVAARILMNININAPEYVKGNLPRMFAEIHNRCGMISEDYMTKYRQRVYITPEVYLTFLRTFVKLYEEKKLYFSSGLESLTNGLQRLHQASEDVADMRVSLDNKEIILRVAQRETEILLKEITVQTEAAEWQASEVKAVTDTLAEEAAKITVIREEAERDLLAAQPAVRAAKEALDQITSTDIMTLRAMQRPPEMIKRIFDGVCILLHHGVSRPVEVEMHKLKIRMVDSWTQYGRSLCTKSDLLEKLNFFNSVGKDRVNDETCELLLPYIWQPDFTYERAKAASGNIAGLCTWVRAMVAYREISKFVAPKIDALNAAEAKMKIANDKLRVQSEALAKAQGELDKCVKRLNEAKARRDQLEEDAISTRRRLTYAAQLIDALTDEKVRWKHEAKSLEVTIERLIGDTCTAASIITYAPPYNTDYRAKLIKEAVQNPILAAKTPYTPDFNFIRYMVDEQVVAKWHLEGLPMDDHSVENALIVKKSLLFPLMLDPQTQAIKWMKNHLSDDQLVSTTPYDKKFLKIAEAQVAEGKPLILEDSNFEKRDPLVYALVERRLVKVAGRSSTISVLGELLDYNPAFKMYMTTRNNRYNFQPEVFAKVVVIDFSVTLKGLEQQLLSKVILSERFELEVQKVQLSKDINANEDKLRKLEDELLSKLSSTQGSLIDDETLILTMQHTKESAFEIKESLAVASETKKRISAARMEYSPVSMRAAVLYFVSVEMASINSCYQLSLERFTEIFEKGMKKSPTSNSTAIRIKNINDLTTYLFFVYVGRGLLESDKPLFSLLIAFKIELQNGNLEFHNFCLFTKGGTTYEVDVLSRTHPKPFPWILPSTWRNILALREIPKFNLICELFSRNEAIFKVFIDHDAPETVPGGIPCYNNLTSFEWLFAIRSLREDRTLVAARKYVSEILGPHMVEVPAYDLDTVVEEVHGTRVPILFLLSAGSDPSSFIEANAKKNKKIVNQISLGQGQEAAAMSVLEKCREKGEWVVFQNCHLGIQFLELLQGWATHETHPDSDHPDMRVFISAEPTSDFPTPLLLKALKLTNEPPEGMSPSMNKVASWVSSDVYDMYRRPEWHPLILSLCYLHSLLLERRKYGAPGWAAKYQFSEGDFQTSLTYLQNHFSSMVEDARRCQNIQWDGVRYMIGEIHYGGRVTISNDRLVLITMMNEFIKPENLQIGTYLCPELKKFIVREASDINVFRANIAQDFCGDEPPQIVGLFSNAETQHRNREVAGVLNTMLSIQPRTVPKSGEATREAVVLELLDSTIMNIPPQFTEVYLQEAAERLDAMRPFTIFFLLEARKINCLIANIYSSLCDLKLALSGELSLSASLSDIADSLFVSRVPLAFLSISWKSSSFNAWFTQLLQRYNQISDHLSIGILPCYTISLIFNPQGFINSIRQDVCRRHAADKWVLDRVEPKFNVTKITNPQDVDKPPVEGVYVHGMLLDGASWDVSKGKLRAPLSKETYREMPVIHVTAQLIAKAPGSSRKSTIRVDAAAEIMAQLMAGNSNISPSMFRRAQEQRNNDMSLRKVKIPCFLSASRGDAGFVCDVDLTHDEEKESIWILRGVAMLCFGE